MFLSGANLSGAVLRLANLSGAYLAEANLSGAYFEPKVDPETGGIAAVKNLDLITYSLYPNALAQLRKDFKDGGFVDQESGRSPMR